MPDLTWNHFPTVEQTSNNHGKMLEGIPSFTAPVQGNPAFNNQFQIKTPGPRTGTLATQGNGANNPSMLPDVKGTQDQPLWTPAGEKSTPSTGNVMNNSGPLSGQNLTWDHFPMANA